MEEIKAKQITRDYWILQQNHKKIGDMEQQDSNYVIHILGHDAVTLTDISDTNIQFTTLPKQLPEKATTIEGYATLEDAYNPVWNLHHSLPMFTLENDSKSWYCAGYYKIKIDNKWKVEFCPKFITLQRNVYIGPSIIEPNLNEFGRLFD